jgi:galactokinase
VDTLEPGDADQLADAVTASFQERHGRRPEGVWVAPGRVNLIGEHVDYNGGLCLPMALPHATYAAVGVRDDDVVTAASAQQDDAFEGRLGSLGPGAVGGWPAYAAGVVWAMREAGWQPPGLDVVVDSRVPLGAGLSSSAALECSVALAVAELTGGDRARDGEELRAGLTRDCMRAESEVAGANTGGLDQTIALFGEADSALLLDCRDWSRRQVPWDPAAAGLTLLVVDTRAEHSHATGGYGSRRKACEDAAQELGVTLLRDVPVDEQEGALVRLDQEMRRRVRHVFTEIARVEEAVAQLEAGDAEGLGATMTASHVSLRDDFEVSCAELDVVVDVALAHGALGARMTGGGFGGSAVALVPTDAVDAVGDAVTAAYADRGWPAPGLLTATPSAGARRLR